MADGGGSTDFPSVVCAGLGRVLVAALGADGDDELVSTIIETLHQLDVL